MKRAILLTSLLLVAVSPARAEVKLTHRWVYVSVNMLVDANVEKTLTLLDRIAKAGYTGVVLTDSKFFRWDELPERYPANVARVRDRCRKLKLDCIAGVFPIGYSGNLLSRDVDLAAALPVEAAPFVVRDGRLLPEDDGVAIAGGDFETPARPNMPVGWKWADEPGKITFLDRDVKSRGAASLRMQDIDKFSPDHGHGRIMQTLKVAPFRYYHVSAAVKTEEFVAAENVQIAVLAKGGAMNYLALPIKPTQDWRRVDICFNTLDNEEVNLYLGVWKGRGGKIWWDDVRIEPAGLVNLVRRAGAPVSITSLDGKTVYQEGRDVAELRDGLCGTKPYNGVYTVWHEPLAVRILPAGRLKEGDKARVSYYHTAIVHDGQVACCMSEPKVYELLAWQAGQVKKHVAPDGYFMMHDEIRVAGWDKSCRDRNLTCGDILADNISRCGDILDKADAGKPIYVWSDMFDPFHNAGKTGRYYLVRGEGPWYGSWKGLPKRTIVVNWHGHQQGRLESLKHFADLGHRQILAGYYDGPPDRIVEWLADADKIDGVVGVMYTTWRNDYNDLEAFADALRRFERARK